MYNCESRGGSSDFWLPTSNFRLPTSDFRLRTSDFRLKTSYFKLQTSDKVRTPDFWSLTAQTQSWMARPSDLPLSTFHFPLPTSDFRLPTSDFQLPISHFWVLTSDFWLDSQFAGINAQIQSSVERTAVPFSPQKRTTKVALEKATKHKANPATDEVRLENRNHGLAWSQSGNNKTVQTLAVNLILACITGALWAKLGERGILHEARNECEALRS